jgi:hypothetical protein
MVLFREALASSISARRVSTVGAEATAFAAA